MAVDRPQRFGTVMVETYRTHRRKARRRTKEHADKFKADWESRFGDDSRIWGDESGGPPEPLSENTLERRADRATAQGISMPLGMLDDPTLPHVNTMGQIKDSIEVKQIADRERGWAIDVRYEVSTDHDIFPLNEFGIGVPQRMTLEPSKRTVGEQFRNEAIKDFADSVRETKQKLGGRRL